MHLQELLLHEGQSFFPPVSDGFIFHTYYVLRLCCCKTKSGPEMNNKKGPYSSLPSPLLPPARPRDPPGPAAMFMDEALCAVPQGHVATGPREIKNPAPSALLTFPTPVKEREHLVFTSRLVPGFEVVVMSCCRVVCVQEPVRAT